MMWRTILARAPLPTLALAAAYGVYRYQVLFTPWYVAAVSALSFELVYLGLAVVSLAPSNQRRAMWISVGAVVVSVVYNSLSALFAIRPALLVDRPLWGDIALAVAHGLPLAVVAYLVADLLLHAAPPASEPQSVAQSGAGDPLADMKTRAAEMRSSGLSWDQVAKGVGRPASTVRGWLNGKET